MAAHAEPSGESGLNAISSTDPSFRYTRGDVVLHTHGEPRIDTSICASAASIPATAEPMTAAVDRVLVASLAPPVMKLMLSL
ncbi:Hypothetical protein, putative [Bodo saltans]|uniref:Uncharacterized protein n=1 Tax=Bodo saltans TaxID=75058 RepID=A0A0S4IHI9_BODSA|nr:Hypothetical protein, putative [Bodo saltans]|eukprot:CUE65370.1 Hypothetical protein, putative [Bodo saltans]